jgi:hypothetical protein
MTPFRRGARALMPQQRYFGTLRTVLQRKPVVSPGVASPYDSHSVTVPVAPPRRGVDETEHGGT